jgi:hypothetical protein
MCKRNYEMLATLRQTLFVVLAMAAVAFPALAGKPTYPPSVGADASGSWSVTIHVTGTADPKFKIVESTNTTWLPSQLKNPDGSFDIIVEGSLINMQQGGSITFTVDPQGTSAQGTIVISPYKGNSRYLIFIGIAILVVGLAVLFWRLRKRR